MRSNDYDTARVASMLVLALLTCLDRRWINVLFLWAVVFRWWLDGGRSWLPLPYEGSLASAFSRFLIIDPFDPRRFYIGGYYGIVVAELRR